MERERQTLTIRLRLRDGALERAYSYAPYGHRQELDRTAAWGSLGAEFRFGDAAGPQAIAELLDRGQADELDRHFTRSGLVDAGHLLFELLFGDDRKAEWETLLRSLFQVTSGPRPNPPRYPLRVRIASEDPLLAALPWRITAWRGRWLLDNRWTFETVAREEARGHVELRAPAKVLVIAPTAGEPVGTAAHLTDLRETLRRVSAHYDDDNFLQVVESRDELHDAVRGLRPNLVYYFGHGGVDHGQACLLLGERGGGEERVTLNDFARLLRQAAPEAVYLNACKAGAAGWQSAGHQLTPEVPCVIAHRTTVWTRAAGAAARRWLGRFLGDGRDPVAALHELPAEGSTRGFEWTTAVAWTSYDTWQTHTEIPPIVRREVGLRLDRIHQRGQALNHVYDLLGSHARRVEAMVVYGGPGALVEEFGSQLRDYLESRKVCLRWVARPEAAEAPDFERLEDELRLWLDARQREGLRPLLRRSAPPLAVSPSTPVLCLDWGVFGNDQRPPLDDERLRRWLLFAADALARHCPPEIRVISYLAMEVAEGKHAVLEEVMDELRLEIRSEGFRCNLLPALADVTRNDLLDYLEDPTNTHCPPTLAAEAARGIFDRTGGRYEETVALIRRGEDEGWNGLLRELRAGGEDQRLRSPRTF